MSGEGSAGGARRPDAPAEPGGSAGTDAPRAVVVGPGRIGLTLAEALHAAGSHGAVQVTGRAREAPAFLAGLPGISYLPADAWRPSPGPGPLELFFAVPDDALEGAAGEWAGRLASAGDRPARAFHTSGARPPEALAPLAEGGAAVGVLHPLRAVPAPRAGALAGAWFGIAGDGAARRRARALAAALGGRCVEIRDGASARYHAAAVLASNLLAGCLFLARGELAAASDASPAEALDALDDLARSALDAARQEEGAAGITGPLVRGDLETVARHLSALDSSVGEAYAGLTRALGREVLSLEPDVLSRLEAMAGRGGSDDGPAPGAPANPVRGHAEGADRGVPSEATNGEEGES